MVFEVRLEGTPAGSPVPLAADAFLDGEEADYASQVIVGCEYMQASVGSLRFLVRGFGRDPWRVDLSYDLATFIEDLPAALEFLQRGEETQIDMCAQGTQCILRFVPRGDDVAVHCYPGNDWAPDPAVEWMTTFDLQTMLRELARDFAVTLDRVCPELGCNEPFRTWARPTAG